MKKDEKSKQLERDTENSDQEALTSDQGVKISDTDNSLKAGSRGPTIMDDFHFREKLTHFDHERIPERVVHARGSGAHGYFEPYKSWSQLTRAKFLTSGKKTPVFVRFSTVVGSRGSADTVRDVRGFAAKFYTEEGNYDLVANNMPVFFIQDGIKFPDLVHSIKPEADNEMPQASAAHDTFWDFISLTPESAHMIMWVLSNRALPRSYSTMDGFGVHTFRFVNETGEGRFVKFHWRPKNGVYSLVWDETQKIAGKDPDFNRRDLWERIENGHYPEFELCVQVVEEADEHKFDFDLLDPTKIIPEEEVPLIPLGKMVLNRNPDNFFAETEQVAFHPGNVVPGIDFTNDPLLQGRLFSYLDTQLIRLGGPNFAEIPINRPVVDVHNNQRDGFMRQTISKGKSNYSPNSIRGGCPFTASIKDGSYAHYQEKVEGTKIRNRNESFKDHYSQATLFWNSMSASEKKRIIEAAQFELGKVKSKEIRQRVVDNILTPTDHDLGTAVALGIGVTVPEKKMTNHGRKSPALSIEHRRVSSIEGRKIAILAMDGVDAEDLKSMKSALEKAKAEPQVISMCGRAVKATGGETIEVDKMFVTTSPVLWDAIFIPGGHQHIEALSEGDYTAEFLMNMYSHFKPIALVDEAAPVLESLDQTKQILNAPGVLVESATNSESERGTLSQRFIDAIAYARFFDREKLSPQKSFVDQKSKPPQEDLRQQH